MRTTQTKTKSGERAVSVGGFGSTGINGFSSGGHAKSKDVLNEGSKKVNADPEPCGECVRQSSNNGSQASCAAGVSAAQPLITGDAGKYSHIHSLLDNNCVQIYACTLKAAMILSTRV